MDHHPERWGEPQPQPRSRLAGSGATTHTQQPMVTGTSVVGVKFSGGVMIAADNLASYGSLARYDDVERTVAVGESSVVGLGGDVGDMQYIWRMLDDLVLEQMYANDGHALGATHIHEYLRNVFYARRSKMDPLWVAAVVGGMEKDSDEPFLAFADLKGTSYTAPHLATGFGAHLATPILRAAFKEDSDWRNLTEEAARKLMDECMRVLFYRDARSIDKYSLAIVTRSGTVHERGKRIEQQSWAFAEGVRGYGAQVV